MANARASTNTQPGALVLGMCALVLVMHKAGAGAVPPSPGPPPIPHAEIEALVEFVGACRLFAGELAINEMTQRTLAELQQYLDSGMRALLDGVRGAKPADKTALAALMVALSRFAADHADQIAEVDLNPVIVHEAGAGLSVVDALIVRQD